MGRNGAIVSNRKSRESPFSSLLLQLRGFQFILQQHQCKYRVLVKRQNSGRHTRGRMLYSGQAADWLRVEIVRPQAG